MKGVWGLWPDREGEYSAGIAPNASVPCAAHRADEKGYTWHSLPKGGGRAAVVPPHSLLCSGAHTCGQS